MSTSPSFFSAPSAPSSSQPTTLSDNLSPAMLDTIPVLTSILSRVQPPTSSNAPGASPMPATSFGTPSSTSKPSSSQLRPDATAALSTKEIPAATDALKHRLQRARVEVAQLPGIGMSIEEQEVEIRALESRIREQRAALNSLSEVGGKAGKGDTIMEGYEDGK
ncbi:hypothetical protein GMDG_04661 [Pseudogymnoascus destructans 20631-21]|uniref:Mediator of RNA polymerase II transcription subunit 9 n=1 Tax=Pseudogymnoascus destructans (strain ATCC MYA-4855 / 20631-21) TaxID=658429 RepID=L8GAN1_PSED2|nr:hypothetical protein GMDG_04661 [Pseudogymnoascus destructans 20631-21]